MPTDNQLHPLTNHMLQRADTESTDLEAAKACLRHASAPGTSHARRAQAQGAPESLLAAAMRYPGATAAGAFALVSVLGFKRSIRVARTGAKVAAIVFAGQRVSEAAESDR